MVVDHRRECRAFVLPLTLILLALAAVAMLGVGSASLQRAIEARQAHQAAQHQWGRISLQHALLDRLDGLIQQQPVTDGPPSPWLADQMVLGNWQYTLIVADEQAKLNVPALVRRRGRLHAERLLSQCLTGQTVRLAPGQGDSVDSGGSVGSGGSVDSGGSGGSGGGGGSGGSGGGGGGGGGGPDDPLIASFAQVLADPAPGNLLNLDRLADSPALQLTCWGPQTLNFHRATRQALIYTTAPTLNVGHVDQILQRRQAQPNLGLGQLLEQLELTAEQRAVAAGLLADQSQCYSLWVVSEPIDPAAPRSGRSKVTRHWSLRITQPSNDQSPAVGFEWEAR